MDIKPMKLRYLIMVAIATCAVLMLGNGLVLGLEDDPTRRPSGTEQPSASTDEQEPIQSYPARKRYIGGLTDVEWDLDNSFPQRGSLLELILRCPEGQDR
jgi:hypothetical protein